MVNPVIGMFVETVFLILRVIYLAWSHYAGQKIFGGGAVNVALAVFAGVVTVVPLLLYHAGNRAAFLLPAFFSTSTRRHSLSSGWYISILLPRRKNGSYSS